MSSLSVNVLHAFGAAPLWEHFWLTAPFKCLLNSYVNERITFYFRKEAEIQYN